MRIFLETDRLLLRYAVEADAELLHDLDSDPEVMRYLTGGKPTPRSVIEAETLPRFLAGRNGGEPRCWIAIERASSAFIGGFALEAAADGRADEAELGYRLRRSAWGKGYATEGSRALVAKGFGELGLKRIWAETMAVNLASRRVMEKTGLAYVRTFHLEWDDPIEGAQAGEVEYAITRAEWLAAAGQR